MAQRYTSLYSIKSNLYALDSPVVIEAGALLKDNKTGGVLGQLKFLNITNKKIISLTISLDTYDISDNYLEETEYTYMDLDASRDDSFGAKTPIVLENSSIRKFNPFVKKVIFDDKSCIELNKCEWQQIPKQEFLSNEFNEKYISAYKCAYSDSAEYFPVLFQKIWLCSCGKINSMSENECHYCNASQKDSLIEKDILQNKLTYIIAEDLTKKGTREAFVEALNYLKDIPEFGDAEKLIEKCNKKIEAIDKANYENQIAEAKASKKRKKIVFITTSIVCACIAFIIILNVFIIPNVKYQSAMKLFNAGKYSEAIAAFNDLDEYKDSNDKIKECNYLYAKNLFDEQKFEEAIAAFNDLNGYKDSNDKIKECNYLYATALFDKKDYTNALLHFKQCGDYKDSTKKANDILNNYEIEMLKVANVGDNVYFGLYEQDNNSSNGKENIEWIVLTKNNNKMLIISEKVLDFQLYNASFGEFTWETCSLRNWLNNTFLNAAFKTKEKAIIQSTTVSADKNPNYQTDPGRATNDKVFLLSINEANKYFSSREKRVCEPTTYAMKNIGESYYFDKWWLRSPGETRHSAAYVYMSGLIDEYGTTTYHYKLGVRPALWINFEP